MSSESLELQPGYWRGFSERDDYFIQIVKENFKHNFPKVIFAALINVDLLKHVPFLSTLQLTFENRPYLSCSEQAFPSHMYYQ